MKFFSILALLVMGSFSANAQLTFTCFDKGSGSFSTDPFLAKIHDGKLILSATDSLGRELWICDGTQTGTHMLIDIETGVQYSNPNRFIEYNNRLYFVCTGYNSWGIWSTDGTATGTTKLSAPFGTIMYPDYTSLTCSNGLLFFNANSPLYGMELWVTDGTVPGTKLVKDINPVKNNGYGPGIETAFNYNNKLYFTANDSVHGSELWATDGTDTGTHMVIDINPGINHSGAMAFAECNSNIIFVADSPAGNKRLYSTDGTVTGTQLLRNLNTLVYGYVKKFNNKLFFTSNDLNGTEPWVTDGTPGGTFMLKDIIPGTGGSNSISYLEFKNKLYIYSADSSYGIWETDGTTTGTQKCLTCNRLMTDPSLTEFNGYYYYLSYDNQAQQYTHLMVTDTTFTISPYRIEPPADSFLNVARVDLSDELIIYDSALYFVATTQTQGSELWSIKGTPLPLNIKPTKQINEVNIYPNPNNGSFNVQLPKVVTGTLTVYDMAGKSVLTKKINTSSENISMQATKGIYIVKLRTDEGVLTRKLIIE